MSIRMVPGFMALGTLSFAPAACADAGDDVPAETSAFTVRDSAGVEIVENAAPLWGEGEGWRIDPEPVLQIGVIEGDEPYQFSAIGDVALFPDGRIGVVDSRTREVRVFDSRGRHLSTIGRAGEGPGEFQSAPRIAVVGGDTLVAFDAVASRFSWFLTGGALAREYVPSSESPARGGVFGRVPGGALLSDGTLVTADQVEPFPQDTGLEPYYAPVVLLLSTDLGESQIEVARFVAAVALRHDGAGVSSPFVPTLPFSHSDHPPTVHIADSDEWRIRSIAADGSTRRVLRADVPRLVVTGALIQEARDSLAARQGVRDRKATDLFDRLPFPDSAPAISVVTADEESALWVSRWRLSPSDSEQAFEVFDRAGRWLGAVEIPPDVGRIRTIGADRLFSVWRDEFDVPYLRVYRIVKGEG